MRAPMRHKKSAGFTLIEILIALVVFAILGLIVAVGLQRSLESSHHVDLANQRIQALEVAQALMRRDITEIVDRPITDPNGQQIAAVLLNPNELDFTRGGVVNPFSVGHTSNLQRMAYIYSNHKIIRSIWPVLDRVANTSPTSMTVLDHVTDFTLQVFDNSNRLQNAWPYNSKSDATSSSSNQQTDLPKAIKIMFTVQGEGTIEDIIPIPSRGLMTQDEASNAPPPTS